ncbi:MAG TPA: YHS domain-containing protein [Thermoanaerobaculia bacterium]
MKYLAFLAAVILLTACDSAPPDQASAADIQTIHTAPPTPAPLHLPPMLFDEAPPLKPRVQAGASPVAVVLSPEDEQLRASLPFSPAIAMDPIDGSKISMRFTTPTFEYKGRIYYFSSEANKKTFEANPDQYLTGRFTQL